MSGSANIAENLWPLCKRVVAAWRDEPWWQSLEPGGSATLDGVCGASSSLVAAALAELSAPSTVLVVCPQASWIDDVMDELKLFSTRAAAAYPALESSGDQELSDVGFGERLRTVKRLLSSETPAIVVASIQSLLQPAADRLQLQRQSRVLRTGEPLQAEELTRWLVEHRFHATSAVQLPGEFSWRGGILDIFATDWPNPVRIELFGDEIESLRAFDVASQRSLESFQAVELTVMDAVGERRGCLTEYLPEGCPVLMLEPEQILSEGNQFVQRTDSPEELWSMPDVMRRIAAHRVLYASAVAAGPEEELVRMPLGTVERFSGDVTRVRDELDQAAAGQRVFVVAETKAEIKRLDEILGESRAASEVRLAYVLGRLRSGFRWQPDEILVVSGNEMFHRAHLRRSVVRHASRAIESFLELRDGDLVVHLSHGIGRYRGLKLLEKDGQVEEHLELEFHGGTKLFVPATKIEWVQKYVGARNTHPRLATIGGKNWAKQKKAAEAAVEDLAAELLQVQAQRAASPGIRMGGETDWQREFDAAFPYTETNDQLLAIDAVKRDMESSKATDRLICGDVGFGKTEIAMRAAFKAVDNGYQVAVLVPTTILAEQHYRSFVERMAEFPFTIGKLSRFCSPQEQKETIERLARGAVDIVVGTHRVASQDVQFQNLGLVVIDEEQRFGVEVKERLKRLRATVEVLTLSATPIPRTLHMSLTGIRDISNLETAPADRVAVETRVTRWSDTLIRQSVLRELNRGGQVYFVHNRVQDIEAVARKIQEIVPEASICIGHGQMDEHDLERVMMDFIDGRFDILLATTIIESGLDIPNANTIFIDEAHHYGLADLHQLRGRVGRYKHRAYCYLLVSPNSSVTPNAARRLRAIEEFSQMGAGFSIAMRDLEIRGAGNVLGTQQSGHIALVGYELYCQLLEAAVRRLKQLPPKMNAEVDIVLPGQAYIPREYVPDMRAKIDLYRRLARTLGEEEIEKMRQEFLDRFGPLPTPAARLLILARLKTEAAIWQIDDIHLERPYLVLGYKDASRAKLLAKASGGKLRVVDGRSIYWTLPPHLEDPDDLLQAVIRVLRDASRPASTPVKPLSTKPTPPAANAKPAPPPAPQIAPLLAKRRKKDA